MGLPGIDPKAPFPAHLGQVVTVQDFKEEAESLFKLCLPLVQDGRGSCDHDVLDLLPEEELLRDQARLDGLAKTRVIGNEEVDAGQLKRLAQGLHLVGVNLDTRTKRRLQE